MYVFRFSQLPVVHTAEFVAQYHVFVRIGIDTNGIVRWATATAFLLSLEVHPASGLANDLLIYSDQEPVTLDTHNGSPRLDLGGGRGLDDWDLLVDGQADGDD